MKLTKRPSGIVTIEKDQPKAEPPKPKKPLLYFTSECEGFGEMLRLLKFIQERRAELVAVSRHGTGKDGLLLCDDAKVGYIVTFRHFEHLEVGRYT